MRKQTKIVATVSDRHCDVNFIKELVDRGVDVFRLNTAHQSPEDSMKVIKNIRAVSEFAGILIDTKGPEVRTAGISDTGIEVKTGDKVLFAPENWQPSSDNQLPVISVSYNRVAEDIPAGATILIDDGDILFNVISVDDGCLTAEAGNSGTVKNRKSVNIPGVHLHLPSLTDKDRTFVRFAAENGIDFIAHSFVRNAGDIEEIAEILRETDSNVKIIAKIENREGVDNAVEIIEACHGLMVARGDLGIEIPAEEVPPIQKKLIKICVKRAKPVITATQMLQSMIENPRPTRAEVSDIANAVLDGTSALMLSGETAYGKYPLESVETMARVANAAEEYRKDIWKHDLVGQGGEVRKFLAKSAIQASDKLPVKAIIVHTYSGLTARLLSSFRGKIPIYVRCHEMRVARELSLSYGLYPKLMELPANTDQLISKAVRSLVINDLVKPDDLVLVLAGSPPKISNESNLIEINTVSKFMVEAEK